MAVKKKHKVNKSAKVIDRSSRLTSAKQGRADDVIELDPALLKLTSILVPIDFSKGSKGALQYAIPFARQFNAGIILLHVVQPHYVSGEFGAMEFPVFEADVRKRSSKQLSALATKGVHGLVPVKTMVRTGPPVQVIVDVAKELMADLVILATHGRTGLGHFLLGSVAENVVRHAPCPVLVVREHEREFVKPQTKFESEKA